MLCSILALVGSPIPHDLLIPFPFYVIERAVLLPPQFLDNRRPDVINLLDALLVAIVLIDFREDNLLLNPAIHLYNY